MTGAQKFISGLHKAFVPALLVLTALAVSAAAAELLLRALGHQGEPAVDLRAVIIPRDDAVLDWRYRPGPIRRGSVAYHYNSGGYRDLERETNAAPGVTRVAVVGDSVTDGYGVAFEDVFAPVLQRLLPAEYEVLNFAQGGVNGPQVMRILELDAVDYSPDFVIYNLVLNDCAFYSKRSALHSYQQTKDGKLDLLGITIDPELKRRLKSSALIYFLKERAEALKAHYTGIARPHYFDELWSNSECKPRIEQTLDLLRRLATSHGFSPLVLVWPVIEPYDTYRLRAQHHWILEAAAAREIPAIDLYPGFSRLGHRALRISPEDNVHPNAVGHLEAAQWAQRWLLSKHDTGLE